MTAIAQALVPLVAYQESRANLFVSIESIRWFVRQQQRELIDSGALLMVAGRHMVSPQQFDAVVLDSGKRRASRKVAP